MARDRKRAKQRKAKQAKHSQPQQPSSPKPQGSEEGIPEQELQPEVAKTAPEPKKAPEPKAAPEQKPAKARLPATSGRQHGKVLTFLSEVRAELRKVQWPDRQTLAQGTAVVVGAVAVAGFYLGLLDFVWSKLVDAAL